MATQYVAKFNKLARFVSSIMPIDEEWKRKFMLGLRVDVAKQINSGSHGLESFTNAVERAMRNKS